MRCSERRRAAAVAIGAFRDKLLILAGFSDGAGAAKANLDLSQNRTDGVLAALMAAAPDLAANALPHVEAFGEALPMACDETAAGRRLNRRVEVWIKPQFTETKP